MSDLTIGAVMEVLGGEYYGGILGGIERVARERDARLLVFRGHRPTLRPRRSLVRSAGGSEFIRPVDCPPSPAGGSRW
jgi:hypothetical protein